MRSAPKRVRLSRCLFAAAWASCAPLLLSTDLAGAEETAAADEEDTSVDERSSDREIRWSTTLFGQLKGIESPQDDDGLGGFFDQYEYTPNKDGAIALELGVREASFDWIEDRAPRLQLRYHSPTSNLGVTGSDFDNAFFGQRALVLGRSEAFQLDLDYRRLRTEELRRYPETEAGGGALPFSDLTNRNDRFYRERTGFGGELRWRPERSFGALYGASSGLSPELSLRGGFERRESRVQQRAILSPGNDWLALSDRRGDEVADVGIGVLVAPANRFTLTLDFDHQRFDSDDARLDDDLPFLSTSRSIGFVPSTERGTGRMRIHGRFGDRAVVTGGVQATVVEQQAPKTPAQRSAGFDDNRLLVYSAQLSGDLEITRNLSASGFAKYVYRDNDVDRSTALFAPGNATQVDELLDAFHRIDLGAEARWRVTRRGKLALGARMLWIDRDLDFATIGVGNPVIQPENALVADETLMSTFYLRGELRPVPRLGLRGELSYRVAPETGYITDLDRYLHGELRGTYTLPLARPATLSAFVRGGRGENSDFSSVSGLAPDPPGPEVGRDYERWHWSLGLSGDLAWSEDLSLFGSLHFARDRQRDDLLLSDLQRYFQELVPIGFRSPGELEYRSDELALVLGGRIWLDERTDLGVAWSYTRAEARYDDSGSARPLQLVDDNRIVEADIHGLDVEIRHQLRAGLRLFAGYRLQHYSDGAPRPSSPSSARRPPDRSDVRHTVSFGFSLDSELLAARR